MRYALTFDASSCTGCKACQVACKDKNQLPDGVLWRRVYEVAGGEWQPHGAAWTNTVFAYNVSVGCNHCKDPACVSACPTGAYFVRQDGVVWQDAERCIGCQYCAWACPYGAPQYSPDLGRTTKCDFCCDLVDVGLPPACVAACPMRALDLALIGDAEEAETPRGAETQRGARPLWLLPATEQPFPLPAGVATKPYVAVTPHVAMTNALPKVVANYEEVRTAGVARARRQGSDFRLQASGLRLQESGSGRQGSGYRQEGAEEGPPRSVWSRVSETWPLASDSWPPAAESWPLAAGPPPSRAALRRASWPLAEWPLVAFTLLAQAAAGAALVGLAARALSSAAQTAIGVLLVTAGLSSLLHLGTVSGAWRSPANARVSPLGREIVMFLLFGVAWLLSLVAPRAGHVAMAACGAGLVYTMGQVYRLDAVPAWNSWRTTASFAASALVLGSLVVVAAGMLTGSKPVAWIWPLAWALLGFQGWLAAEGAKASLGRSLTWRIAFILVAMVGIAALPVAPATAGTGVLATILAASVGQELLGRRAFYTGPEHKLM